MPMPLFYYAELTMSRRMSVKEGNKQNKIETAIAFSDAQFT